MRCFHRYDLLLSRYNRSKGNCKVILGNLVSREDVLAKEPSISMDSIDKIWEKLKEWARKIVEALLGPETEPEPELIPIPVDERQRRQH